MLTLNILSLTERGSKDEWSFLIGGEENKMRELTDELLTLLDGTSEGDYTYTKVIIII